MRSNVNARQLRAKITKLPRIHASFIVMQMSRVNREKGYSVPLFSSILNQIAKILKFMHFISILA